MSESDGQMMWGVRVISRVANNVWTCLRPKTSMDCWSVRYKFHCIQRWSSRTNNEIRMTSLILRRHSLTALEVNVHSGDSPSESSRLQA